MKLFMPQRVIFEPASLEYPLGKEIYEYFKNKPVEIINTTSRNSARYIPGTTPIEKYADSKRTILITTNKNKKLDVCKPSADFQFSLVSNCPGSCEYCYLQTTQGAKPYLKVFVNLEDIFNVIEDHIKQNEGKITTFEAASLGDPLALEHITGSLKKTIEFFSNLEYGRLRVVTKYNNVDTLLKINHKRNTHFRISINSKYVVDNFEHNTNSIEERIDSVIKLADADYPIGFIVAPIMRYDNWKEEYCLLFQKLAGNLGKELSQKELTFELIQHRFTANAKELILKRFPKTKLDMNEENRSLKWGRFGRYKYVYPKEQVKEIKHYIASLITERFPNADIKYFT
ncbi:MAG: spore photoproduct lyase [Tissierellia bacterium]|nr:spore photoproduct lyase [Tissierellia bacterium]